MRRGFLGVLLLGLVALVAGLVGYQAGLTSTAVDAGKVVIVGGGWFPGFGFLVFLVFVGFLFFAIGGRRHGHWGAGHGHGGPGFGQGPWGDRMGPGGQGTDASSDPRRQWIADIHRGLHEEEAKMAAPTSPTNPPATG
jgi:hypothetical protein